MRPLLPALAVLALMAAPLAAQTDTPFGVQIVRGPATEPPSVASDAWIDPSGFFTPVMITRGGVRIAEPRPVVAPRGYGLPLTGIQGIVKLPIFPRQVVWWDWTREYRRYYAGRVW